MSVRSRVAAPGMTVAKAFGGDINAPPAMAQAAELVSQMGPTHPFSPGIPVGPYDGYSRTPRTFNFETSYNVATRPRTHERVSFDTLRGLIESYDVAEICCVPGTEIITKRGLVAIEDVSAGDEVITHLGRWRRVTRTMVNRPHTPVRTMKARGLEELSVTGNHPVYAVDYGTSQSNKRIAKGIGWVSADKLRPKSTPTTRNFDGLVLPTLAFPDGTPVLDVAALAGPDYAIGADGLLARTRGGRLSGIPPQVRMDAALGRLLGWYVAEGSTGHGRDVHFTLGGTEQKYADQILADAEAVFGLRGTVSPGRQGSSLCVRVHSSILGSLFSCGTARTKRLPQWAWAGGREFFSALLEAWALGDGCRSVTDDRQSPRIMVATSSRDLAWQMRMVAISLGHFAGIATLRGRDKYEAIIRGKRVVSNPVSYHVDWREKPQRWGTTSFEFDGRYLSSALASAEESGYDGPVYNLEVEEDESYVTTGGTVHNCIWHRIDTIRGLDWQLVAADGFTGDITDAAALGKQVLKKPDGLNSFSTWLARFLYDVLAYDAGALYRLRNRAGRCIGLQPIEGSSIAPLLDYWGNSPHDPAAPPEDQPEAFVQYVNGLPWNWLTRNDLIYEPFRPRTNSPYGRAPIESLLLNANTDIRFQLYFLQRFTQGNVPEAFASAPEGWDGPQIERFQAYWDSLLYGDQARKNQIRWIPGGAKIAWSNEKDFTDDFSLFLMRKTCLDEQTEILTRRGWVHFPKLIDSDEVATRSADGQFEWQKPTDYIAEPHSGDMVQFKSNSLDLLVTPEHRMLLTYFPTTKHPRPKEFIRTAGEIVGKGGYMIPMRSQWEGSSPETFVLPGVSYDVPNRGGMSHHTVVRPDVVIPMRTWAAFLGLFLAEGHTGGSKGGKNLQGDGRNHTYKVGISQAPASPYFGEMQELLSSLPFRWIRTDHGWECQDKRLHTYLAPLGNSHTKYIPQDAKDLSPELLEIMWAWACKGDGHHYLGKWWQMLTASERLAGDWQEVLQKCGRDASVSWRKPSDGGFVRGKQVTNCAGTWIVRERSSPLRSAHGELVPYEGMVYCVTVPNGVIYVRRNGRPAWVGNCACFHVVPSDLGFTETVNLASSESQVDVQHRVGELPLDDYIENLITAFLQDDLGLPLAFQFDKGEEQEDQLAQAQADQIYIQNGSVSASEIREMRFGLAEPVGQVVPRFIMTSRSGPVPLSSLMGVAGKIDPETASPEPGVQLPHMAFTEVPGVVPNPPLAQAPLAEQEYGPAAIPPAPPMQAIATPKATAPAHQVAKEGETAGVTSETGVYGYDGPGDDDEDDDEREAAVAKELAAFRRFSRSRQRAGTWRDFRFGRVDAGTARALNAEGQQAVAKAVSAGSGRDPKAWPGWTLDAPVTAYWAAQMASAATAALPKQRLAELAAAWLASDPPADGSKRERDQAAAGWLADQGVTIGLSAISAGMLADAFAAGAVSAAALVNGTQPDANSPGDTSGADDLAAGLGLGDSLGAVVGAAGGAAASMQAGYLGALGKALTDGQDAGLTAPAIAASMSDVVSDQDRAASLAADQVTAASGQAAQAYYGTAEVGEVVWLTESVNPCPVCQANADEGPVQTGTPFSSGDTSAPIHPNCACAVVPA